MAVMVRIRRSRPEAVVPNYSKEGDAGVDLHSCVDLVLKPGQRALVPTGIHIALPPGFEAQVRPRSGLALKHGITIVNTPGTVDSGYRGEISVILLNTDTADFHVEKGMRIAQMVITRYEHAHFEEVQELDETARGSGGFGSTGTHTPHAKN